MRPSAACRPLHGIEDDEALTPKRCIRAGRTWVRGANLPDAGGRIRAIRLESSVVTGRLADGGTDTAGDLGTLQKCTGIDWNRFAATPRRVRASRLRCEKQSERTDTRNDSRARDFSGHRLFNSGSQVAECLRGPAARSTWSCWQRVPGRSLYHEQGRMGAVKDARMRANLLPIVHHGGSQVWCGARKIRPDKYPQLHRMLFTAEAGSNLRLSRHSHSRG